MHIFKLVMNSVAVFALLSISTSVFAKVTYPYDKVPFLSAHSANYNHYIRSNDEIDAIVIHTTENWAGNKQIADPLQRTINYFKKENTPHVSAHYVIGRDGTGVQMVNSKRIAHHATYYNGRSIGFEMAGYANGVWDNPNVYEPPSNNMWFYEEDDEEYGTTYKNYRPNLDTLANICAAFCERYSIPVVHPTGYGYQYPKDGPEYNKPGIVGHYQVQHRNKVDPGQYFPWEDFILMVQSYVDYDENRYYKIPEPASLMLLSLGGFALLARRRK